MADSLKRLSERVQQVLRYHFVRPGAIKADEVVAHFTSWAACKEMLSVAIEGGHKGLTLWAGNSSCLNDPLEGGALLTFTENPQDFEPRVQAGHEPLPSTAVPGHRNGHAREGLNWSPRKEVTEGLATLYAAPRPSTAGWTKPHRRPSSELYLVSFCRRDDRLDLWRAYADRGQGVCMVMPLADAARALPDRRWCFYRVLYDYWSFRRAWTLLQDPLVECLAKRRNRASPSHVDIRNALTPVLHLYKHPQYATEDEVRLVYQGKGGRPTAEEVAGDLRPIMKTDPFFLRTSGCRVIVGPAMPEQRRRIASLEVQLRRVFKSHVPEVQVSGVPFQ